MALAFAFGLEPLIKDLYESVRVMSSVLHGLFAVIHQQSKCPASQLPETPHCQQQTGPALQTSGLCAGVWGSVEAHWTGESWTCRCGCEGTLQAEGFLPVHSVWFCRACLGCLLRLGVLAYVGPLLLRSRDP